MKLLRRMLKGVSLTAAMFVFQACYGTPEGCYEECSVSDINVFVRSAEDGSPIEDIKVQANLEESGPINHLIDCGVSDSAGYLHCSKCISPYGEKIRLLVSDNNEVYVSDTVAVNPFAGDTVEVFLKKAQ